MKTYAYFISLLVFSILLAPVIHGQDIHDFKSVEGKCSATFPGEYNIDSNETEYAKVVKVMCNTNTHTFLLSYSLHKNKMDDHENMAEVSYESFIEAVGGQELSKEKWEINGHKGLKAIIEMPANNSKVDYRVVLVGDIQYQLASIASDKNYDEAVIAAFNDSFDFEE